MPEAASKASLTMQKGPANPEDLEGPFCMVRSLGLFCACMQSAVYILTRVCYNDQNGRKQEESK